MGGGVLGDLERLDRRPRERLLHEGVHRVSDCELISLVLGHGTRQNPVTQVAEALLRALGGLGPLARASPHELIGLRGVGEAQAARLIAAVHLGGRAVDGARARDRTLGGPEAVWRRVRPRVIGLTQEIFVVIAMNSRGVVIDEREVARGTLSRVDVHPRDVFRPLIQVAAACAVVAHNHPSGDATPSVEDVALTFRLREVGDVIGIPIVDHVVVTEDSFRSINEHLGTDAGGPPRLPD
jgi:DNA repair protein RadC